MLETLRKCWHPCRMFPTFSVFNFNFISHNNCELFWQDQYCSCCYSWKCIFHIVRYLNSSYICKSCSLQLVQVPSDHLADGGLHLIDVATTPPRLWIIVPMYYLWISPQQNCPHPCLALRHFSGQIENTSHYELPMWSNSQVSLM